MKLNIISISNKLKTKKKKLKTVIYVNRNVER